MTPAYNPPEAPPPTKMNVEHIYRCLSSCDECTGDYVSEALGKWIICYCNCHNNRSNDAGDRSAALHEE